MNSETRQKYLAEVALSIRAEHAYNMYIKSFLQRKADDLFAAFCTVSVTDTESVMEIKRQQVALKALEINILADIETGMLAQTQLELEEPK